MKKIVLSSLLVLCLAVNSWATVHPQQRIEELVTSVLGVLQQNDLSFEEKKSRVSERVLKHLDTVSMAQRALGPFWKEASTEQRQRFTQLFVKILEGTYANKLSDYSGGSVKYLRQRVKGNKAIIDTEFVSDGFEIPLQYKMVKQGENWQVFDVAIEGISLIRNYRSSYGAIIRQSGYAGLFDQMEQKISAMSADQA